MPEPTKDELNHLRYYIGTKQFRKPYVVAPEPDDPYLYKRLQEARKRGVTMDELEDEPDNLPEDPEQNWEESNEQ